MCLWLTWWHTNRLQWISYALYDISRFLLCCFRLVWCAKVEDIDISVT